VFVVCLVIGWFSGFLTVFEGGGVYHFRLFPMGIDRKRQRFVGILSSVARCSSGSLKMTLT